MTNIELVAWDVYGTIIDSYHDESSDIDNPLKLRPGALEILTKINSKNIVQNTISDGNPENLKNSLKEAGISNWRDYFFDICSIMVPGQQKDIENMINYYNNELGSSLSFDIKKTLVIGDNYDIDLALAKKQGCQILHVPILKKYGVNPLPVDEIRSFT